MNVKKGLMKSMFKGFSVLSGRFYAGEDGADGGAAAGSGDAGASPDSGGGAAPDTAKAGTSVPDAGKAPDMAAGERVDTTSKAYLGNEKVNPDKRPLKEFNRTGMSKAQIDQLIEQAGEDIFAKPAEKKVDDKKPDVKPDEKKGTQKEDPVDILKELDVTEEEFLSLPEKVQEKLFNTLSGKTGSDTGAAKAADELKQLKSDLEILQQDTVVAARLEELRNGQNNLVARELKPFGKTEMDKLDQLLADNKPDEALAFLNEQLKSRSKDAVSAERSVQDRVAARKSAEGEAMNVIVELSKIDPKRLGGLKETDLGKMNAQHKEWATFNKTIGPVIEYCKKSGMTLQQIKTFGADKVYKLYAAEMGWDKERDAAIYSNGFKDFVAKLKGAPKTRTLDNSKGAPNPMSNEVSTGFNRDQLLKEVSEGNVSNLNRLLEQNDGDPKMIRMIGDIRQQGIELYKQKQKQSQ